MKLNIEIKKNNVIYSFGFLNNSDFNKLVFKNEFVIYLIKNHNHSYYFKAFFYHTERIYVSSIYLTKKELYIAVQNILKEEMYYVIQFPF